MRGQMPGPGKSGGKRGRRGRKNRDGGKREQNAQGVTPQGGAGADAWETSKREE